MKPSTVLIAQLMGRRPLLPFLVGLLVGQAIANYLPFHALEFLILTSLNFLFLWALRKRISVLTQVLAFGLLTGVVTQGVPALLVHGAGSSIAKSEPAENSDLRYFTATLLAPARRPIPGAAELSLLALERRLSNRPLRLLCRAVDLPWRNLSYLQVGDVVQIAARILPIVDGPLLSYAAQLRRKQISARCKILFVSKSLGVSSAPWWFTLAALGEQELYAVLPRDEISGLLLSISLGTRDVLSQRTEQTFRTLGLTHVLVVSGFQVSLLCALCYWFFSRLLSFHQGLFKAGIVRVIASALGACSSLVFVALCGFEASAVRALVAVSLVFLALTREHDASLGQAILLTGACLSALWPGCLFDVGMQLTFAALLGIWAGQPLSGERAWPRLRTVFYATLCPSLVAALWFQPLSLQALFVNMSGAPLLASAICVGTLLGLGTNLAQVDPHGWLLRFMYECARVLRDSLWALVSPADLQRDKLWYAWDYGLWILCAAVVSWRLFLRTRERLCYARV